MSPKLNPKRRACVALSAKRATRISPDQRAVGVSARSTTGVRFPLLDRDAKIRQDARQTLQLNYSDKRGLWSSIGSCGIITGSGGPFSLQAAVRLMDQIEEEQHSNEYHFSNDLVWVKGEMFDVKNTVRRSGQVLD